MAGEFVHADVGGELTESEYHAILGHILDGQARGDMIISNTLADGLIRLPLGTQADDVLVVNGAVTDLGWSARDIRPALVAFVESAHARLSMLGPMPEHGTWANNDHIGLGWSVELTASGSFVTSASTGWQLSTGATQNSDIGFFGTLQAVGQSWVIIGDGIEFDRGGNFAANDIALFGATSITNLYADTDNMIAFRLSGTGNILGVCDSGGTETIRDTGVDGTAAHTHRIEANATGPTVKFYMGNSQVGADVTTNVHTFALPFAAGLTNGSAGADRSMVISDIFSWRGIVPGY